MDDYKFLRISDAVSCINQKVNLIGAVVETTLPRRTRGTDCLCSIRIVDESQPSGITISVFMETMERLPLIQNVGDIVVVSRVVIKPRGPGVYALFNKKYSTFALFEGRETSIKELVPYQVSPTYKPRDQDKKCIMQLRKQFLSKKIGDVHEPLFLKGIKEGEPPTLICKILHVAEVEDDRWMVFIWDGTDAPPLSVESKSYEERVPTKWGRLPNTSFPYSSFPPCITETEHPNVPTVTLMDILTHPEVTYKYKTVVRIVALFPWRAENFRSSSLGIYRVRLTLEDPTARIHAFLYDEDAEKFFKNCQSVNVLTKMRNTLLGVAAEEDDASSMENVARNPPWIHCCLKSYYIDEGDVWGSRNYRIFDTTCIVR